LDQQRRLGLQHSLELVRRRLGFLAERAAIDAELGNQHLITRTQIVDTKVAIGGAEEEFDTTQRRINEIALDATNAKIRNQRELLGLDLKIEAAARATSLAAARLQQAEEVMSPYDGEVVEIQHDVGELVQEGAALMTVLPAEPVPTSKGDASPAPLLVMLFVPDTDGKKITAGMTAEITPSTVRREEYGFIVGRVKQVAAIPSTPEGMTHVLKNQRLAEALSAGGAPFAVELELIPNAATPSGYTWSSGPGPNIAISPGTLAHGDIWIRRLRLIEFAVPALHGLLGSRI
jgi:HlyD family secretion protein